MIFLQGSSGGFLHKLNFHWCLHLNLGNTSSEITWNAAILSSSGLVKILQKEDYSWTGQWPGRQHYQVDKYLWDCSTFLCHHGATSMVQYQIWFPSSKDCAIQVTDVESGPNFGLGGPGALSLWGAPTPGQNFRICDIWYCSWTQRSWGGGPGAGGSRSSTSF